MGSINTPRLYRKRCGTYFFRALFYQHLSSSPTDVRQRKEVRVSLRTKDPALARRIGAWVNAKLESCRTMTDRRDILANIKTWTLDGLTVDGEDDQARFQRFYDENPDFKEALLERTRRRDADPRNASDPEAAERTRLMRERIEAQRVPNPTRSVKAIEAFATSKSSHATNTQRTLEDKKRLLAAFFAHIVAAYPELGADPFVHDVHSHHVESYLSSMQVRRHRDDSGRPGAQAPIAPATVLKKISDLRSFFIYVHGVLQATRQDPTEKFASLSKDLRSKKTRQKNSYAPFTDEHLRRIFNPRAYLAFNRDADYFWAPLIGVHTGLRLGEIVTLSLNAIQENPQSGIWSLEVIDETAKNGNSMRRVPVPTRLIELGFLQYVHHVRGLGATVLFPHRDMTTPTFQRIPSKRCGEQFGKYLDTLGISDDRLVFHSLRHNVVTALQDGNTPLSESMQIVGHAAQDHAVLTGRVSTQHASSVHTGTYTHADAPRMNVVDPLARLRDHLDRCVTPPLDYRALCLAAAVVQSHTVSIEGGFESGWSKLLLTDTEGRPYTEDQLRKLE